MPQASEEMQARWPGGDEEASKFLRDAGYHLTPDWRWVPPRGRVPHKHPREIDAILYLIHEWDYGGWITVEELGDLVAKQSAELSNMMAEILRLRGLLARIAWHTMGKKLEHQAPEGNRLQNIYSCVLRALGREETKRAIEMEPPDVDQIPGPKGGI